MESSPAFLLRADEPLDVAVVDAVVHEAGATCRTSGWERHVDIHLDDPLGSLARAGVGLWLREDRRGRRLVCHSQHTPDGGLFVGDPEETAWGEPGPPGTARAMPDPLRDTVEPFVLDRPLEPVLRLEILRESRVLESEERDLCELAIDRIDASAGTRSATFFEIELDAIDDLAGTERLAAVLQKGLPLEATRDDAPDHARSLLGRLALVPAGEQVREDAALAEAVTAIAARHLDAMRHAEVAVRADHDPGHLHTMRVAVRRLRCLVRAFRELWPAASATWLQDQLGELGRRLGARRDFDVMLDGLRDGLADLPALLQPAGEPVAAWIRAQRSVAQSELQAWLRSDSRLGASRELENQLAAIDRAASLGSTLVGIAVPEHLRKAVSRVRKLAAAIGPDLPLAPTHELRIASKRLRYLAEDFADLPGHDYGKSLQAVVLLQQALGQVCDHEVAIQRLLGWLGDPAVNAAGPTATAVLGGLATRHALLAKKARKKAARCLGRTDRKKVWRRFAAEDDKPGA